MKNKDFDEYLKELKTEEKNFRETKDNQTYIYIYQLTDIFFGELSSLVIDKKSLKYDLYNVLRKSILEVFNKSKDFVKTARKQKEEDINELLKLCFSNNYVDLNNLNNIYTNFEKEINNTFDINKKITTMIEANFEVFKSDLYSKTVILKKSVVTKLFDKYKSLYINELINNITFKKDNILGIYKNFINNVISDVYDDKRKIRNKNLVIISNVSYDYLKRTEFANVDSYTKANKKLIVSFFSNFEKDVKAKKLAAVKIRKVNNAKDYLLDFCINLNGIVKNVFEEMNDIVSLDNEVIRSKLKDFNELITHIFEINLVFDKQFNDYKNCFIIRNNEKFNAYFDAETQKLVNELKANIFNAFRDNIKIYNDILYKTMLLKSQADGFDEVLSITKVKDLLLK